MIIPQMKSILDTDLYKLTMQQAVLSLYPEAYVTYEFTSRKNTKFSASFCNYLRQAVDDMADLNLSSTEEAFLSDLYYLSSSYIAYLKEYAFDPSEVKIVHDPSTESFKMTISGLWHKTILWEVPLLALISELYFKVCDTSWNDDGQQEKIRDKGKILSEAGCKFSDFGTRRRRDYYSQDRVVRNLKDFEGFMGTSNVHFAMKYNVNPIGTMAHEWIMGVSALESLRHANRFALQKWDSVYKGNLSIALTDTFGTDIFFGDFDQELAENYDGVRHDSGDPFVFATKVVDHYKKLGIDHTKKVIVFSDGLDPAYAVEIQLFCNKLGIPCLFGIGTNFTNDYVNSLPLNIVIKLKSVDGIQVVKVSDVSTKATGDFDALRVAMWTFKSMPLDTGV